MSRTNAISIFEDAENTQAKLNEMQAGIVENLQKSGNSFKFKSQNANLDEKAGSYVFKRFVNSEEKDYGTARTAGKGDKIQAPEIPVNLDKDKEIVEEVTKKDAERFGLDASVINLLNKRKTNHQSTLKRNIEKDFWTEAYLGALCGDELKMKGKIVAGISSGANAETIDSQLESAIIPLEKTENKFVNGVDRDFIGGVLDPNVYSKLKTRLNTLHNINFSVEDKELTGINGVVMFSENYLPKKVDYIIMAKESVAQPVIIDEYNCEKIPLSNDFAVELFSSRGTKTLAGDLIVVGITIDATHTKVVTVDALPTTAANVATDTIYIATKAVKIGDVDYSAGDMFTATKDGSTITWTQYNV